VLLITTFLVVVVVWGNGYCRRVAMGCSELPSKCTVEFSYSETTTYKIKIEFCCSHTTSLIL